MNTTRLVCLSDYEREADDILPRNTRDYFKSGADDEKTLEENVAAYSRLRIIPRVLREVDEVSIGDVSILGETVSSPICVAPSAFHGLAHDDAEIATASACAKNRTLMGISTCANLSIEEIAGKVPTLKRWLQLYVSKDLSVTSRLLRRAEKSGYTAVAVTVDTPYLGKRRADERNNFELPSHLGMPNLQTEDSITIKNSTEAGSGLSSYVDLIYNHSLTWEHIKWLRKETSMKIVLKGIHSAEDAVLAVDAGVDAIWVSNHGGRQLDSVPATIELLPEIKKELERRCASVEVYVDGGIRTGTDVFKALALGADAVFIGRPVVWGLAVNGEQGVSSVLNIINSELKMAMALSGCSRLKDINSSFIRHQSSFSRL